MKKLLLFVCLLVTMEPAFAATEAEVMAFLEDKAPDVHGEMLRLEKQEPAVFAETFPETSAAMTEYLRVLKFDANAAEAYLKMFIIDFDVVGYADKLAKSSDKDEIARLRARIKKQIGKSFDQWVVYERARLKHLQGQLKATISNFEKDAKNKEAVVEYDTESLIEESRRYLKERR